MRRTPQERRCTTYGIAFNRGYLLGLEHGLNHPNPTCVHAMEGALKELPEDEREYWRARIQEAMKGGDQAKAEVQP